MNVFYFQVVGGICRKKNDRNTSSRQQASISLTKKKQEKSVVHVHARHAAASTSAHHLAHRRVRSTNQNKQIDHAKGKKIINRHHQRKHYCF